MRSVNLSGMACAVVLTLLTWGCDKGGDAIAQGRRATKNQDYAQALKHFDEALKADPDSYDALWGKADVYRRDSNLAEQSKTLEQLLKVKGLDDKRRRSVVEPALELNYRKQAEAAIAADSGKAEEFLRKAIELRKKSEANASLADLLMKKGDAALGKAEFDEAKKLYDEAIGLRISRKMRSRLKGKAEIAEFMAFKKGFMPRFEQVKADLIKEEVFNEKGKAFVVTGEAEVEGKPGDEDYEKNAERAGLVAVTNALSDLSWRVAGKPRPENARVEYSAAHVDVLKKGFTDKKKPRTFAYVVAVPQDAVFEKVLDIDNGKFITAAPTPEDGAAPEGEQPKEEEKKE